MEKYVICIILFQKNPLSISLQQTIDAWNNVFYISAGFYVLGALIFVTFGRTSVQPWNTYWEKEKKMVIEETTPLLRN